MSSALVIQLIAILIAMSYSLLGSFSCFKNDGYVD